jgi:hypothetical protein
MSLRSAVEDLRATTLVAFPGVLAKLKYLGGLRRDDGSYSHWGLSRVHGELAAQKALAETHSLLITDVLRAPLRKLMEDAEVCGSAQSEQTCTYLEDLSRKCSTLLPDNAGGGSARHFNSVLRALSALARHQQRASRPGA